MMVLPTILLMTAIILMIIGVFSGKDILSKMISVNCTSSYIIAFIALMALTDKNNIYFLDVALIYGAIGFVASVAFLKYTSPKG